MIVHEEFIKEKYDSYIAFLSCRKVVKSPFVISDAKERHPSSIYAETEMACNYLFGDVKMSCEIKNSNVSDFSYSIMSSLIPSKIVYRFDSDGPEHKNKVDYIPLSQQGVPTPHYHQFDMKGNLLAHQSEDMADKTKEADWKDVDKVFSFFCQEMDVHAPQTEDKPRLIVSTGTIPFDFEDPTNGISF